jgi:hypothetical protein
MSETHDCTRLDHSWRPIDGGQRAHIAAWSGKKPQPGDYLILANGDRTTRYRVESVDLCMNVDPPTMWTADLTFAPRDDRAPAWGVRSGDLGATRRALAAFGPARRNGGA